MGDVERLLQGLSIERLLRMLTDHRVDVRRAAVEELGDIGGARAAQPLLSALTDENSDVGVAAAKALGKISDAQADEALPGRKPFPFSLVRGRHVESLARIGDAHAIGLLLRILTDDDPNVRRVAVDALGKSG